MLESLLIFSPSYSLLEFRPGNFHLSQFPDGEIDVQILEDVRNKEACVLQSIAKDPNKALLELMIISDALNRSGAKHVTAIIPYFGYSRQDRRDRPGTPITAKLVANVLEMAGIDRIITFDLHSEQFEGFFSIPVDHLHCQELFLQHIELENPIIVAPDTGSIRLAERMARLANADLAIIQKRRMNSHEVEMRLMGDVSNRNVLIVDDLCSTGGTLAKAANLCKKMGAGRVEAAVTHGLFVSDAINRLESSRLDQLYTTDTVQQDHASSLIKILSIAPLLREKLAQKRDVLFKDVVMRPSSEREPNRTK